MTPEETYRQMRAALPESMHSDFDDLLRERDEAKADAETSRTDNANWEDENDNLHKQLAEYEDHGDLEDTLLALRYWFHDFLVLGKPLTNPRAMMQLVDRTLHG